MCRFIPESTGAVFDRFTGAIHWTDSRENAVTIARLMLDGAVLEFVQDAEPGSHIPGVEWADDGCVITDRDALETHIEALWSGDVR